MVDDQGRQVKEAGPSVPVEVLGLSAVPSAGDPFTVVENEARAREVADYRQGVLDKKRTTSAPVSLENMFATQASTITEVPLVIKADVQGSIEAIVHALNRLSTDEIKVRVLHSGVGAITESDVTLASASGAPIIGFNVRPNAKAREVAERNKVEFRYYDVIYHLTDWVKGAMAGELGPEIIETVVGRAEGPGGLPGRQEGQGRRPAGPRGRHPQGPQRPPHPRGRHRVEDDDQLAPPVQGRRRRSARRASSAACCWPTPTTSSRATCSRCSRSRSARGRSNAPPSCQRRLASLSEKRDAVCDLHLHGPPARFAGVTIELAMRKVETPEGRSVRLLRVGEQVRHVLSELLQRGDVHDDVLQSHLVSVTEVRMSPDLRHATVFVKPLLGQDEEAVLKALRQNTAFLQREVAHRVRMKYAAKLKFLADESFDESSHIDRLLRSEKVALRTSTSE